MDNFFYYLIMVVLLSGSLVLLSFNIFHDASHGCFSPFGFINGCITFFTASIIGVDALLWYEKHVKSHHTYTNIHGTDYDIEIGMFVKCSQYHPLRFWHRWQAYYALVLFALTLLVWVYYYDFFYFFILFIKPFKNRKNKNYIFKGIELIFGKMIHILLLLIIPAYYFHSILYAMGSYILVMLLASIILMSIFQLAHICSSAAFYKKSTSPGLNRVKHQLSTTVDFIVNSQVANAFLGGLNMQVIHHLFPYVSHVHYPKIQPIVSDFCKEYHLSYHEFSTFKKIIGAFFTYLHDLSRPITSEASILAVPDKPDID